MSISYDAKGNTTGTTLTGTGTNLKITSSAAYDSTGNYVSSQTDARGNTVTYTYGSGRLTTMTRGGYVPGDTT